MHSPILPSMIETRPAWYAQRWPWLLMLGPLLVILAGGYTTWLAFTRPDALVVGDYYNRGKAINKDLRRDRVASELGLGVTLRYDAAHGTLNGKISAQKAVDFGTVGVHLVHSTMPEKDIRLVAQVDRDGVFSVVLPLLERARWQVLVQSPVWRLNGSWDWPQQAATEIHADPAIVK